MWGGTERLIPAHAGKTRRDAGLAVSNWAHPRSRGENRLVHWPTRQVMGSSPLTRGKHRVTSVFDLTKRLIPAHAGKTMHVSTREARGEAHPRSRGENRHRSVTSISFVGSSPLTRGKRFLYQTYHRKERLIPAHAGKTRPFLAYFLSGRAHPRSRGENRSSIQSRRPVGGSSPLTRGKRPMRAA